MLASIRLKSSIAATGVFILAITLAYRAEAQPAQVHLDVDEVSVGVNDVIDASGNEAYATVLATRPSVGVAMLIVRICFDLTGPCDEYAHQLAPGEYYHSPTNNIARITATVQDLGLVDLDNYSFTADSGGQITSGHPAKAFERSIIYVQGVPEFGARAAHSAFAHGGKIGPWSTRPGLGINALKVSVTWLKL